MNGELLCPVCGYTATVPYEPLCHICEQLVLTACVVDFVDWHVACTKVVMITVVLQQNMQQLMDPTRNMSNYRNLLALQLQQSPAVSVHSSCWLCTKLQFLLSCFCTVAACRGFH